MLNGFEDETFKDIYKQAVILISYSNQNYNPQTWKRDKWKIRNCTVIPKVSLRGIFPLILQTFKIFALTTVSFSLNG
jgi:hypothetical protein